MKLKPHLRYSETSEGNGNIPSATWISDRLSAAQTWHQINLTLFTC